MNPSRIDHTTDQILLEISPQKGAVEWGFLAFAGILVLGVSVVWILLLTSLLTVSGSISAILLAIGFFVLLVGAWRSWLRQALGKEVFVFQKKKVSHYWQLPIYKDKRQDYPFNRLEIVYSRSKKTVEDNDENLVDDFLIKKEEVALGVLIDGEPLASWLTLPLQDVEALQASVDKLLRN